MNWLRRYQDYHKRVNGGLIDVDWINQVEQAVEEIERRWPGFERLIEEMSRDEMWMLDAIVEVYLRWKEVRCNV